MASALGRKINELRKAKGMTLEQLAQATESSKSYMWEVENKDVARPSGEKLNRLAAVLGVTPEYLADPERTEVTEDETDRVFYRKYESLPRESRDRLRRILDALEGNG